MEEPIRLETGVSGSLKIYNISFYSPNLDYINLLDNSVRAVTSGVLAGK